MRTLDERSLTTLTPPPADAWPARSLAGRTILIAASGTPESIAAARVALALARRRGALPEALRAFDPGIVAMPGAAPSLIGLAEDLLAAEPHQARKRELRAALAAELGESVDWPTHVRIGTPAGAIVREAEKAGAAMIVVGLRRHGVVDRVLRDETALHVARVAGVPVLCVVPSLEALPRRVVVGVDFSRASLRAARAALSVVGDGGTLVPAYVRPDVDYDDETTEGLGVIETHGVAAAFERLRAELAAPSGVQVEPVVLRGEPGAELRSLAERAGADLVAVGSHRHEATAVERWLLGSVTTDLVRDGRVSVLVVPPARRSVARRYQ